MEPASAETNSAEADVREIEADLTGSGPRVLSQVRRWLGTELAELSGEHRMAVIQVADELATNAYEHGGGPGMLRVRHRRRPCLVTVEVTDSNLDSVVIGHSRFGETAHRGRGLVLVKELSVAWGVREEPDEGHKTVWAEVGCAAQPCA